MDTIHAFVYAIYYYLKDDSDLAADFDGSTEWLHHVMAAKDAPFPYLVHRISSRSEDPWVMRQGVYDLDVWDYARTADRVYRIRKHLVRLLDRAVIGLREGGTFLTCFQPGAIPDKPELVAARLYMDTDGWVPDNTELIWHYSFAFDMRYTRSLEEISGII